MLKWSQAAEVFLFPLAFGFCFLVGFWGGRLGLAPGATTAIPFAAFGCSLGWVPPPFLVGCAELVRF